VLQNSLETIIYLHFRVQQEGLNKEVLTADLTENRDVPAGDVGVNYKAVPGTEDKSHMILSDDKMV
jgi:hypothetical protein